MNGRSGSDSRFYSVMSVAIAAIVGYGFSQTIEAGLLHPEFSPPPILYVHAVVFSAWIALLVLQSSLVRLRRVRLHRRVGLAGVFLGCAIPIVGLATAVAMARVHAEFGSADEPAFLIVSVYDMLAFSVPFALSVAWRNRPEFHRRLMLMASCALTVAAFNRFPAVPANWGFAGVDLLILIAAVRDRLAAGRVHRVYLYGFPAVVAGQLLAMYVYLSGLPLWVDVAKRFVE